MSIGKDQCPMFICGSGHIRPLIHLTGSSIDFEIKTAVDVDDAISTRNRNQCPVLVGRARPAVLPLIDGSPIRFAGTAYLEIETAVDIHDAVGAITNGHEIPVLIVC